jgi:PAS domain S-box-containing protein
MDQTSELPVRNLIDSLGSSRSLKELFSFLAEYLGTSLDAHRVVVLTVPSPREKAVGSQEKDSERSTFRSPLKKGATIIEWCLEPNSGGIQSDEALVRLAKRIQSASRISRSPMVFPRIEPSVDLNDLMSDLACISATTFLALTNFNGARALATAIVFRSDENVEWSETDVGFMVDLFDSVVPLIDSFIQANAIPAQTHTISAETRSSGEKIQSDHSKAGTPYKVNERTPHSSPNAGLHGPIIKQLPDEPNNLPANVFEHPAQTRALLERYHRLIEHSDAVIFNTDPSFVLTYLSRRSLDLLGITPEEFSAKPNLRWFDLVHPDDRLRVEQRAFEMKSSVSNFEDEFRIINQVTGRVRWLLAKLVPIIENDGKVAGWDGFAIDTTTRREALEALNIQSKKIRALYTVSTAIRGYLDPANIASRGLSSLCDATGADAALCYLHPASGPRKLTLAAQHGFSADLADRLEVIPNLGHLAAFVSQNRQPVVIPDIGDDPRTIEMSVEEDVPRSLVMVPIAVEDQVLGALGLFSQQVARFDGGDVMLISAAANQIGLAARQAYLFSAYRKQTKNLAALYRMSHELSKNLPLDQIFQHAFTIIRDELGLKRLWLGLLNETGTRIIGQSAYGSGWKRQLVEINVEVSGREHPIARVVASGKPVVIDNAAEVLREFGVKRIFSRLAINAVTLVPLKYNDQVLGVLAVQPITGEAVHDEEALTLLGSLSNEIAAILMTKRLEERIDQGEKMRTASLLAAGIAHNFNNLLQAMMGQASLLEMQRVSENQVRRAAKIITESAQKGATLVKQLLSVAHLEEPHLEASDINDIIERSLRSFANLLKSEQTITLKLEEQLPKASVDQSHLVRILASLISNASEAMERHGVVEVFTESLLVDRNSPHYEVPFGRYVRVGVRDNGSGMDEETRRRCFEPFFTTKDIDPSSGLSLSGAGLGLAAAYALARRNRGRMAVESKPGQGSLFTIYLQVHDGGRELPLPIDEDIDLSNPMGGIRSRLGGVSRAITVERGIGHSEQASSGRSRELLNTPQSERTTKRDD